MILETCDEKCGYAAAFFATICLGSFGVPIKSEVVSRLDVDPLVMQTYKTAMCFLTCWLIIPLGGEPFRFTPWGIVSGLFWVPGGWAGIFAIRSAGLAVAKGTWSSVIVLTSFAWGIFVFEEHVKTKAGACCACATLISGLIGMSWFSRPQPKIKTEAVVGKSSAEAEEDEDSDHESQRIPTHLSQDMNGTISGTTTHRIKVRRLGKEDNSAVHNENEATPSMLTLEMESLLYHGHGSDTIVTTTPSSPSTSKKNRDISIFNGQLVLTQRQAGILASLFNGLWGGTNMIPLHFAAMDGYGGPAYVISFACGATLINLTLWTIRYLFELYRHDGDVSKAYHALPSFHVREMWHLGGLSGLLWSMGNFGSIVAVTFLGQGVGYSFTQGSMLISGLWGIFIFKEIIGRDRILWWLASASVAVAGILWLSYEHA